MLFRAIAGEAELLSNIASADTGMTTLNAQNWDRNPAVTSIACILGSVVSFSLGDMTMKHISQTTVPLHQAVALRSAIALILTLLLFRGGKSLLAAFRTERPVQHLLRGLAVSVSNITYFAALAALPMADTAAIFFIAPMLLTAFSAIFIGDHVGPFRWAALVVGFGGVLLIIRPGSPDFEWVYILPALSAAAYAVMQTITRGMGLRESTLSMALYAQVGFLAGSLALGAALGDGRFAGSGGPAADFLLRPWVLPTSRELTLIVFTGVTITIGGYLVSQAYRLSSASVVAPFEYTSLALAVTWGVLIWGDVPDALASIGIALILLSGLTIALREARAGRKKLSAQRMVIRR
ncbi:DMT family transporter [Roseibium sediminicola]|uniref:DMT family transporter n=1 Tax=Roseibium sediminicola TaxID=2933272 RepID=A0ABT0GXX4_9HYPH|nr:DMT family transporter [Roseibium sp. CAU 1639]MCK7613660.1 DMT family transporter [Roseibium sp. CAU 1639]